MKKKLALIFLIIGILSLIAYIYMVFKTNHSAAILWLLISSLVFNTAAVNMFFMNFKKQRKRSK